MLERAEKILGVDGLFDNKVEHFIVRDAQVQMAQAVEQAIEKNITLIAESGTGTGKTFAYLVPILLSHQHLGKKALISTGTKHLQEQLFFRDLPFVLKTLGVSLKVSLLKGRSNYLCLQRLEQNRGQKNNGVKSESELELVYGWSVTTDNGDISELTEVAEDSSIWPSVTSTVENCVGQACAWFEDCFVNKARKKALLSDLVIINHHLYFADKSLKEDGFGSLLPTVDSVVFDEAHQIPDIAATFLGKSFSSWQVLELCKDVRAAELQEKSLNKGLLEKVSSLEKMMADYRLSLGLSERRVAWNELLDELPAWQKKMSLLCDQLLSFSKVLERSAVAGEALHRCYERSCELSDLCKQIIASDSQDNEQVRWVEVAKRTFRVNETPLNIGKQLSQFFDNEEQARVFTSATLSIDGGFEHFRSLMGLPEKVEKGSWDSPFDFYNQAVLYVPEGLPEPKRDEFAQALFDAALPILMASEGGAFVLFTSFKVMQLFESLLLEAKQGFNVFMQGESNKRDLLDEFGRSEKAVLLGTMSFWEGVDVPGDKLRCVIIDKLPFESPFDPVIKARLNALSEAGMNSFMDYQVPRAVITLRQGAGRLIRSQQDKGVLMIADSRLRGTHYGKLFLNSLPVMRRTTDEQKVCAFLKRLAQATKG